jgi:hypothetical protein
MLYTLTYAIETGPLNKVRNNLYTLMQVTNLTGNTTKQCWVNRGSGPPGWGLDDLEIIFAKSKEVKTGCHVAQSSKEGHENRMSCSTIF